jgi:hypothetical protein
VFSSLVAGLAECRVPHYLVTFFSAELDLPTSVRSGALKGQPAKLGRSGKNILIVDALFFWILP